MKDEPVTFCPLTVHLSYPSSPLTLEILNFAPAGPKHWNQKVLGLGSGGYMELSSSYSVHVSQGWCK